MTDKKAEVANAADEKQVKKAAWKARDRQRKELEDVAFILSTPEGRRFFWRYLEKCGIFKSSFSEHSSHLTSFMEGERSIGLQLMADMNEADPEAYAVMQRENRVDGKT